MSHPFGRLFLVAVFGLAALANDPSAQALLDRGIALGASGRLDDAEGALLDGARRFPSDSRFPMELAGVSWRRRDIGAARAYLRAALRINPQDSYGNDFMATLFLLDGNLPAALKYWNRVDKPLLANVRFDPPPPLTTLLRERSFDISAGQVFTVSRLLRTEANLDLLDVLAACRYDLVPLSDQRFDLTIRPQATAPPLGGWLGEAVSSLRGLPYQEVHLDFRNIAHRTIDFTSSFRWDPRKRRVQMAFSGPLRFWRYRLFLDARNEYWGLPGSAPHVRRAEWGAELERNLTARLTWTIGTRLAFRQFQNAAAGFFFANGWTTEIRNRLDARLWDWPERRLRLDAWGILRTGRILTTYPSRLLAPEAALRARWFPQAKGEKYSVAAELRAGAAFGNVPLDELYILGMERDNDLWLRGHVGTQDGRKGSAPMGRQFLLARSELNRTLFQLPLVRLQAGPCFDFGRIGDPSGRFGSSGWLYDAALQAKIGTAGGFEFLAVYGRNLRDGSGVFYTAVRR